MQLRLVQFSVVIAGKTHNPSLLNPDFLAINGIVPREWNWKVVETITTPALAQVRYENGMSITLEPSRLQVAEVASEPDPGQSNVKAIAEAYVRTLPHVPYVAVGNNFHGVAEHPDPGACIKSRFLQPGPWDNATRPLEGVGVRLVYGVEGGRMVLSVDAGEIESGAAGSTRRTALVINGNFHRPCAAYPAREEALGHLGRIGADWGRFREIIAAMFQGEC